MRETTAHGRDGTESKSKPERDSLVDIPTAARFFAVGRATLYRLVAARRVPCVRVGGSIRVRVSELEAALRHDVTDTLRQQG